MLYEKVIIAWQRITGKVLALQVAMGDRHHETLNLQNYFEILSSANHMKKFGIDSFPSQVPRAMALPTDALIAQSQGP